MSVKDHGIEGLRKATIPLTPGDGAEYQIRTTGTYTPSGLQTALLSTTVLVGDTATPLPLIPLSSRNSLIIYNRSTTVSLYIGNSDVTADSIVGTTSGWEIPATSYFSTDIKDTIILYGICPTGQTAKIQILEVA